MKRVVWKQQLQLPRAALQGLAHLLPSLPLSQRYFVSFSGILRGLPVQGRCGCCCCVRSNNKALACSSLSVFKQQHRGSSTGTSPSWIFRNIRPFSSSEPPSPVIPGPDSIRGSSGNSHNFWNAPEEKHGVNRNRPEIKIVEVGPRDGLQNETRVVVSTKDKISLIQKLAAAGCRYIEAGSFVSPKWVPSMANSVAVMEGLNAWRRTSNDDDDNNNIKKNLVLSCLVPNKKGLDLAIQTKADEIAIFASASEAFSHKNLNCSIEESMARFSEVVQAVREHNTAAASQSGQKPLLIRGYISCVIACPYQGPVDPVIVAKVAVRLLQDLDCHEVSLGDTIGVGTAASVTRMLHEVQAAVNHDNSALAVHFHDTYGQALANILASMDQGIRTIDSSVAGLGGCPYAKGASGNVATEDVVYMLNGCSATTGIDLDRLVDAGEFICQILDKPSNSKAGKAILAKRTTSPST